MLILDIDEVPKGVPNPPPWRVHYINDTGREAPPSYNGVLPEAHTDGLIALGHPELLIRLSAPKIASVVLDGIGIWVIYRKLRLYPDQQIQVLDEVYTVVASVDMHKRPVFRLAWRKDPKPGTNTMLEAITEFNDVLIKNGLPPANLPATQ